MKRDRLLVFVIVCAAMLCALLSIEARADVFDVRLAKARVIVAECYPDSGFRPYIGHLLRAHERHAERMGAPGFAGAWYWSLVYGGANAKLKVGAVFPGNCAGPMDCKTRPRLLDPRENIDHHTKEMALGWSKGYRGIGLAKYVMLPSAPRDWGSGQFAKADAKHRAVIEAAYRDGRLR